VLPLAVAGLQLDLDARAVGLVPLRLILLLDGRLVLLCVDRDLEAVGRS